MEIVRRKSNPGLFYAIHNREGEEVEVGLITNDDRRGEECTYWDWAHNFEPISLEPTFSTTASKDNVKDRKPPYRYISKELLDQCAYAMLAGEMKYGAWNYLKGHTALQLIEAMERHLAELKSGIDFDKDCSDRIGKQVHHLGNVLANVNMYLTQLKVGTLVDDRPEQITNAYKPVG